LVLACTAGIACGASAYPYGAPAKMAMEDASYASDGDMTAAEAPMAASTDRRLAFRATPADPPAAAEARHAPPTASDTRSDGTTGDTSAPDEPTPSDPPPKEPSAVKKPLLIYKARLHLAVFEATATIDAIDQLASDAGGYLVSRTDRAITVRVPARAFRTSIDAIIKHGDVLHREEKVQDVTEQFFDLRARLANARVIRRRLEQLLDRAKDVKEALLVETQLGRITAEIETLSGKLKLFRELIAFSTISVELKPRPVESIDSTVELPFPWLRQLGLPGLLKL
jgi:hypothetical protein